jgi:hypothetical protein
LRLCLGDDGEDLNGRFCNVIEHPDVAYSQAILRPREPTKPFDPASADLRGREPQVHFQRITHLGTDSRWQVSECLLRLGSQDDIVTHSSQIIARFRFRPKRGQVPSV